MNPLKLARSSTSICQISNRHVFIFNGNTGETQNKPTTAIEYLDLGPFTDINSFKKARWETVVISASDFVINDPRASAQLSANEIIVFGG